MNSGNSKTPDPHRLLLNLFKKKETVALSNLSIYYAWKIWKNRGKIIYKIIK